MTHRPLTQADRREATSASRIAARNDAFRAGFGDGMVILPRQLEASGWEVQSRLEEAVRDFNAFTAADDPDGEHQAGAFTFDGRQLRWAIAVYATPECFETADPLDPAAFRVLTLMFAEDG